MLELVIAPPSPQPSMRHTDHRWVQDTGWSVTPTLVRGCTHLRRRRQRQLREDIPMATLGARRGLTDMRGLLAIARKLTASKEILLWMTPSEAPKALQASECSELLDPMRASCWISAQH